jgi:hypothetical protein
VRETGADAFRARSRRAGDPGPAGAGPCARSAAVLGLRAAPILRRARQARTAADDAAAAPPADRRQPHRQRRLQQPSARGAAGPFRRRRTRLAAGRHSVPSLPAAARRGRRGGMASARAAGGRAGDAARARCGGRRKRISRRRDDAPQHRGAGLRPPRPRIRRPAGGAAVAGPGRRPAADPGLDRRGRPSGKTGRDPGRARRASGRADRDRSAAGRIARLGRRARPARHSLREPRHDRRDGRPARPDQPRDRGHGTRRQPPGLARRGLRDQRGVRRRARSRRLSGAVPRLRLGPATDGAFGFDPGAGLARRQSPAKMRRYRSVHGASRPTSPPCAKSRSASRRNRVGPSGTGRRRWAERAACIACSCATRRSPSPITSI